VSPAHKFCGGCGVPLVTGPSGLMEPAASGPRVAAEGELTLRVLAAGGEPAGAIRALLHVQLAIPPGGEEAARAFYGGLLALEEIPKPPALRGRGGVWYRVGVLELHLGVEQGFRPARKAHPAFAVAHLQRLRDHLQRHRIVTRDDTSLPDRARFYCDDPFGNRLEFVAEVDTDA
jgi:hypothetical protein